ncbi:hypothetical protein PCASD_14282 [Puccinia coronata f. sp. avenae]|uniref:AP complex subunit beta n=1 Tax=Puccinia coronata f. sp. avenae TaxID=200324 RepID=A0A2N5TF77_9BASI|nr:hypothetical protein PCASD_14282 [Puccinia coronata f. sp. avenae]
MSQDAKLFSRGKVQELRAELQNDKKDKGFQRKKNTLKKIVANMTMCMGIQVLEIKKMVYLYLTNYARSKPDLVKFTMDGFLSDSHDRNPLIRALAIRTMSYISVPAVHRALLDPLRHALKDTDPYVRKTAAICVAKLFTHDRKLVEKEQFVNSLRDLLADSNPTVIANAVAALTEISEKSENIQLRLNLVIANKLLAAMNECSEWGQTYIIEALMYYVPEQSTDAEILDIMDTLCKRISASLITLLSSGYEVQYIALRNILLIIQRRPAVLKNQVKVFFCKYNDPIYVKLAKLEIIYRLASDSNYQQVLAELAEYATEVDVDFVRKAVRSIGRLAIKIPLAADRCITVLLELVATKISYVVQEAIVVIKDIFRKYPNQYEGIIGSLCQNLEALDTPEAKASIIWIIGQYADRIENSDELRRIVSTSWRSPLNHDQVVPQAADSRGGARAQDPEVGHRAGRQPGPSDRGFIYWRLLSTNPAAAKHIIMADKPLITTESESLDPAVLDRLLLQTGTLSSVYHRRHVPRDIYPPYQAKYLSDSPALNPAAKKSYQESLEIAARRPPPVPETLTVPKPVTAAASGPAREEEGEEAEGEEEEERGVPESPRGVGADESSPQQETEHMGKMGGGHRRHSSVDVDERPSGEQDDPYAALSSLDPAGFFPHPRATTSPTSPAPSARSSTIPAATR